MKKNLKLMAILFATVLCLTSCGKGVDNQMKNADTEGYYVYTTSTKEDAKLFAQYDAPMEEAEFAYDSISEVGSAKPDTVKRKIIYTSEFYIRTKEYDKSLEALNALCEKYDAYFENSNSNGGFDGRERSSRYIIRVPVENYNSFIGETSGIGVVTSSSQNNNDVTEQYYDTEARLASATLREERILEILKNAQKLDDVLALERELSDVRYEIESMTGALRKLDSLVSYSTVTINLQETSVKDIEVPKVLTFGERIGKAFSGGLSEFCDGFENFVVFLSYNIIFIAIWAVIIVVAIIVIRKLVKRSKKKKAEYAARVMAEREEINNSQNENK